MVDRSMDSKSVLQDDTGTHKLDRRLCNKVKVQVKCST